MLRNSNDIPRKAPKRTPAPISLDNHATYSRSPFPLQDSISNPRSSKRSRLRSILKSMIPLSRRGKGSNTLDNGSMSTLHPFTRGSYTPPPTPSVESGDSPSSGVPRVGYSLDMSYTTWTSFQNFSFQPLVVPPPRGNNSTTLSSPLKEFPLSPRLLLSSRRKSDNTATTTYDASDSEGLELQRTGKWRAVDGADDEDNDGDDDDDAKFTHRRPILIYNGDASISSLSSSSSDENEERGRTRVRRQRRRDIVDGSNGNWCILDYPYLYEWLAGR